MGNSQQKALDQPFHALVPTTEGLHEQDASSVIQCVDLRHSHHFYSHDDGVHPMEYLTELGLIVAEGKDQDYYNHKGEPLPKKNEDYVTHSVHRGFEGILCPCLGNDLYTRSAWYPPAQADCAPTFTLI